MHDAGTTSRRGDGAESARRCAACIAQTLHARGGRLSSLECGCRARVMPIGVRTRAERMASLELGWGPGGWVVSSTERVLCLCSLDPACTYDHASGGECIVHGYIEAPRVAVQPWVHRNSHGDKNSFFGFKAFDEHNAPSTIVRHRDDARRATTAHNAGFASEEFERAASTMDYTSG